jgi:hypothetical protein
VLGSWSLSPTGRWVITPALKLVDVATGEERDLADRAVSPAHRYERVWWNGDDSVLFPAGDWLVRCPYRLGRSRRLAKSFENTTTSATGWLEVACVDTTPRHRTDT